MKILLTSDLHAGFDRKTRWIHTKFWKKAALESPDVVVLAGDLGSTKPEDVTECLATMREVLPDVPAVAVLGNHDLWGGDLTTSFADRLFSVEQRLKDLRVTRLTPFGVQVRGVNFYGYDGWYADSNPPTNDTHWMGSEDLDGTETHLFFRRRAKEQFQDLLSSLEEVSIAEDITQFLPRVVVTHTPITGSGFNKHDGDHNQGAHLIHSGLCRAILFGHSHRKCDAEVKGVRVLNCGSDYNNPRFITFEV